MTLLRPAPRIPALGRSDERLERRRLALEDRRGAILATLATVGELLAVADALLAAGWVQEAWYVTQDASGRERAHGSADMTVRLETVTRTCLVGAVVLAAGGPAAVAGQPARRSIEALWHALARREDDPVDWCPPAVVHAGHARDLVRWNDRPRREQAEVRELVGLSRVVVARERERLRAS